MSHINEEIDNEKELLLLLKSYKINEEINKYKFPLSTNQKIEIAQEIELIKSLANIETYIKACVYFIDMYDYDYKDINKLLCKTLSNKIKVQCNKDNTLITGDDYTPSYDLSEWA